MLNGNAIAKKAAKKISTYANNENGIYFELKKIIKL
jgi:hydroxymethylpyrimidine pyrophosphatase-like HAD family hydrolase